MPLGPIIVRLPTFNYASPFHFVLEWLSGSAVEHKLLSALKYVACATVIDLGEQPQ